ADFEALLILLGSKRASINGVGQDVLNNREVPDIPPLFGVLLLPFGEGIAQAPLAVPPGGTGHLLLLQSAPDEVGTVTFQRPREQLLHNGGRFLVHQKVVLVVRVLPVTKGRDATGKLTL